MLSCIPNVIQNDKNKRAAIFENVQVMIVKTEL